MPTAFKDALSTSLHSAAINATPRSSPFFNDENNIRPEYKPHKAFDSDSVPVVKGVPAVQPTTNNPQVVEKKNILVETDQLDYILDSFHQSVAGNPEITPSAQHICQEVLHFITKPDRQHECEEFCGIWQVKYEELVHFINESCNFGLKPRLTYFDDDSTLIVEMPSAIHEAPLVALHTVLTCFLENIPFNCQALNANILSNIEASDSLVPDMRISFQNMRDAGSEVIIPGLAETAFSQHGDALINKLEGAIIENPSLLLVIAAVMFKNAPYHLPKRGSDTGRLLLQDPSKRSAKGFISKTVSSVWFKVWVCRDDPIDIYSDDPNLVVDGFLYPEDTMAPVLTMMGKGVNAIRERLISLCKEIDDDVDVDALWDPTIVFRVRKEDIITKIAGAMHETTYCHYSVWYKKALKAAKCTASITQLGPSRMRKLVIT
ncbi:uncharacterized protein BJ212DRAFT_1485650 [Suillus subaureus]|uniref:Uncharacterized protein n=1 Tax=Suillus subaureus TaxID=48587 RepID=A0A9P7E0J6_9AGAM|nr:uncharacterized protein BJ212DRAFT_1485650 [Suillus subaureus]KAG1807532.1 hypothetical protein BJ212DRAFT_1485650 [Suillus subaureus]